MSLCRYLDTFQQGGLLLARDLTHLDHDALVSLGVTATGHRKRILRLVGHVQSIEGQAANQAADLSRHRCQSVTEWRRSAGPGPPPFEVFRNSSAPNLAAMLTNSAGDKPVDHTRPLLPGAQEVSQDHICLQEPEGLSPGDSPSAENSCEGRRSRTVRRPSRSWSLSAPGPFSPPVPPRTNCGVRPRVDQGVPSSLSSLPATKKQNPTRPEVSCPGVHDNNRLPGFSPSGSPRASRMEMVSNEIYWGTMAAPPTPPRQAADPRRNR
ncbi:unnamed protein product [Tetraodon nigroviridis]|uniref:(spotted green pufferfish) hypothetical protein n=1 Tax=Tetraodon nigroviridis TaxID=99883 RepID=Q4T9M7_TETNG|nr:unnamed protein product [Tetraodon nigroviridis]